MTGLDNPPSLSPVKTGYTLTGQEATLLGGRVTVFQPDIGDRASLDSILLAASIHADNETILEAGCGSGVALLCAAHRLEAAQFIGIDVDGDALARAAAGIALAGIGNRCGLIRASIASLPRKNAVDQSFANPPYYSPSAIRAPHPARARVLTGPPVKDWLRFMLHVTRPGGKITLIHRAAALADILGYLAPRAGEISVLPIFSRPNRPAKRVLVRGRKGQRGSDVTLHAGLALRDGVDGGVSARLRGIENGEALDWR